MVESGRAKEHFDESGQVVFCYEMEGPKNSYLAFKVVKVNQKFSQSIVFQIYWISVINQFSSAQQVHL